MAETLADIRARLEADPQYATLTRHVNGVVETLDAAERGALLDEWAANERQRQLDTEAEAGRKTIRDQVRTARTMLIAIRDDANMTNAEAVQNIRDLARIQLGVITVLIDRALVEGE